MKSLVSRDVTARGIRTRIVEGGSGPPVVFIHGLFSDHHAFAPLMAILMDRFHVVAVDLPGFGDSESPSAAQFNFDAATYAEVVVDTIAGLQLGRSHVVGHGFGASVAMALAAAHPELVNHLCLISPEVYRAFVPPIERFWLWPIIGSLFFRQFLTRRILRSYLAKHMYAPGYRIQEERFEQYFRSARSPASRESTLAVMRSQLDRRPEEARLTRIKAPTLIIAGRSDLTFTTNLAHRMVRQIPNCRVEFLDAGHSPHEEQPELLADSLRSFFPRSTHERFGTT